MQIVALAIIKIRKVKVVDYFEDFFEISILCLLDDCNVK